VRGFDTRSLPELVARHHRRWGSADGACAGARHGECAWVLHQSLPWALLRSSLARVPPFSSPAPPSSRFVRGRRAPRAAGR
jgi:hypothetical protein